MISLYVLVFKRGSSKTMMRFLFLIQKIIKGQSLTNGTQIYAMAKKLLSVEALSVFLTTIRVQRKQDQIELQVFHRGSDDLIIFPQGSETSKRDISSRVLVDTQDFSINNLFFPVKDMV